MKINELMIGDWVSYKKVCSRIAPADFDLNHRTWIQEVEPIPLTTEILEKYEFVKKSERWVLSDEYTGDEVLVLYRVADGFALTTEGLAIRLQDVHELQHLLKLCGIDKEIEL